MTDPDRNPMKKQLSKTSLEKSLQMISPPQQAPITIYPGPSARMANMSKVDLDLAQRLESLRKSHVDELPTEEEMASRLAHLKGLPSDHYTKSSVQHQRPDTRTDSQRADDLISQAIDEVSLEANVPKAGDELEARLARLRGEEVQARGAVALPPTAYPMSPHARADATLGEDLDDMSMDEVEALMKAAEKETSGGAAKALQELQADPELAGAVAQATKRKEKGRQKKHSRGSKGKKGESSDEERHSKSYDSDIDLEIEGGKAIDAVTEQEEVQRIIDMYTKRAQLKKEKKRKKKEAAAAAAGQGGAVGGDDSDSDIEVGSESDLSSESSMTDELSE